MIHVYRIKTQKILHFTTLCDKNRQFRFIVRASWNVLYLPHDKEAISHLPKHYMLPIQEITLGTSDEELAAIGAWSTVGH